MRRKICAHQHLNFNFKMRAAPCVPRRSVVSIFLAEVFDEFEFFNVFLVFSR